jgi:3-dehydroquinate synthase
MEKIRVDIKENPYEILIGKGILKDLGMYLSQRKQSGKCVIITNPTVAKLYGSTVEKSLSSSGFTVNILEVPDSETSKSLRIAESLYKKLIECNMDRNSCIIALGGGVIGDLAGFIAATYMRGISLVQVPTTLLAQVDSAIGGKVAVDLDKGKNLIGAFFQPILVLSDVDTLRSLPDHVLRSGLAEVIKYGIISDKDVFDLVDSNMNKIFLKEASIFNEIIIKCSKIKAKIIEEDEKEQDIRAILNFGHTLGHALETITNYEKYSHGEAISIGMVFASRLSMKLNTLTLNEFERIKQILKKAELPIFFNESNRENELISIMLHDKKVKNEKILFILPKIIGDVYITDSISEKVIYDELGKMLA